MIRYDVVISQIETFGPLLLVAGIFGATLSITDPVGNLMQYFLRRCLGGIIESDLSCIPPNPDRWLADISKINELIATILGLEIMSNLIHNPFGPLSTRVHILLPRTIPQSAS